MTFPLVLVVAWGALAFGGVYPWAYWPLLSMCAAVGVAGLLTARSHGERLLAAPVGVGLAVIVLAVLVQLVPLPRATLAFISPAADVLITKSEMRDDAVAAYVSSDAVDPGTVDPVPTPTPVAWHPLSVAPRATWLGLVFLVTFSIFLLGAVRIVSSVGAAKVAGTLVIPGTIVAVTGFVQGRNADRIYGVWQTFFADTVPFGPFGNRNHFAGWMVMMLALSLGYVGAGIAQAMRGLEPGLRGRLLWFGSPQAARLIGVAFLVLLMSVSLVMTVSRSGALCFAAALVVTGWVTMRRQRGGLRRAVVSTYLVFVAVVVLGLAGVDALAQRFAAGLSQLEVGRRAIWEDTIVMMADFPLVGTGLNTYGRVIPFYRDRFQLGAVEAHNDYLQILSEGGALLTIPVAVAIGLLVREAVRRFREERVGTRAYWIRLGAITGLVAIALQEVVEFSLQMPGNAVLFCVLVAITVHRAPMRKAGP